MTEFVPILIAGIMVFILAALVVSVPQQTSITGAAVANGGASKYLLLVEDEFLTTRQQLVLNETFGVNRTNSHLSSFKADTTKYDSALIELYPTGAVRDAAFVLDVNGKTAYSGHLEGETSIIVTGIESENMMTVRTEPPAWEFWAQPEYTVNMRAYALDRGKLTKSFTVREPKDAVLKMFLRWKPKGTLSITLNGNEIFNGETGEYLEADVPASALKQYNVLEMTPSIDGAFSIEYVELAFNQ
ncbi:MAG: hypothetical protein QXU82_02150 [Candidatus Aenigmatarchaeota archaeon]